jgi:hypothetical protein
MSNAPQWFVKYINSLDWEDCKLEHWQRATVIRLAYKAYLKGKNVSKEELADKKWRDSWANDTRGR